MENLRKRSNVFLETDPDHFKKLTSKPTFQSCKLIHENLAAVHMTKKTLILDKPIYAGMCILDLRKTLMYDFHYNFIKATYGEKASLLMSDTDSLFYEIKTEDIYEDFDKRRDLFDNSDYDESSKFFFKYNKKVIGKFKDEACGGVIIEAVFLKPKMYSFLNENKRVFDKNKNLKFVDVNDKKAKGVQKYVVKKEIIHQNYLDSLFKKQIMKHKMNTIRSDCHKISSYQINKTSLSCYDDKRYILNDKKVVLLMDIIRLNATNICNFWLKTIKNR